MLAPSPSLGGIPLDPAQDRLRRLPPTRSALVTGQAGSGKTTAALRRVLRLVRGKLPQEAILFLTPTEDLAAHAKRRLRAVGLKRIEVHVLDRWLFRRARAAFPHWPVRRSSEAGPATFAVKRHPAVREVLALLMDWRPAPANLWDLYHLWGDTGLLADLVDAAGGDLTRAQTAEVARRVLVQFSELRDEDAPDESVRILTGWDGRRLSAGTRDHDAGSLDAEDAPVLFALHALHGGEPFDLPRYRHVVVDEAQEVAPMELAALRDHVAADGAVTVVGDAFQQTDPTAWFGGWDASLAELGLPAAERIVLDGNYRTRPDVHRFAKALLAGEVATAPFVHAFPDAVARDAALDRFVDAYGHRSAIVCGSPASAAVLARRYRWPGAPVVTTVDSVKGLEFEAVAIPDADARVFPDVPERRRALYVAVTRSRGPVWIGAGGPLTPLIAPA